MCFVFFKDSQTVIQKYMNFFHSTYDIKIKEIGILIENMQFDLEIKTYLWHFALTFGV